MLTYPVEGKNSFKPSGDYEADMRALARLDELIHQALCEWVAANDERRPCWERVRKRLQDKRDAIAAIYAPLDRGEMRRARKRQARRER